MPDPITPRPRKSKKGKQGISGVTTSDEKLARAHAMIVQRIDGASYETLAKQFNCCPKTAFTYVNYAREHGLYIDRARLLIEEQLLPRALAVFQQYLDGVRDPNQKAAHDLSAAKDILFGLGVLSKTTTLNHTSENDTLDAFRATYFAAREALPSEQDSSGRSESLPDQSSEDR